MSEQIVAAIRDLQERLSRGERISTVIPDDLEPSTDPEWDEITAWYVLGPECDR